MAAETGSGKTGAFCLPIIQIVWETLKDLKEGKGSSNVAANVPHSCKYFNMFIKKFFVTSAFQYLTESS